MSFIKCDPRVYARCPTRESCEIGAEYAKDSECAQFAESVLNQPATNADVIRRMSDEELADAMCRNPIFTVCDAVCKGDCKAVDTLNDTKEAVCKRTILDWLRQPAEED